MATAGFSFFINLLLFAAPLYMLQVYDRVLASRSESTLVMLTIAVAMMLAVMGVLELIRSKVLARIGLHLDGALGGRIFSATFRRALSGPGAAHGQPLRDLDTLREFSTGQGIVVFFDAPWTPLFIAVAWILHPILGMVSLAGAVIILSLAIANELLTRRSLRQGSAEAINASEFAESTLRNAEVLRAMGMLPALASRWRERHHRALGCSAVAASRAGMLTAASKTIRMFLQSLILGVGAWLAIKQEISPGAIIACSIIMGRALAPVEMAVGHWKGFSAARSAFARLSALLDGLPAERDSLSLPAPKGALDVDRVIAAPPGVTSPVLKGVSFALQPGEIMGVVGPSAAGKSTLARCLMGVWPAAGGTIRLDAAEIASWNPDEIGPHLGYLPQDVELFDGTVAENIARFGKLDAAKVVAAAQAAGVHEMILHLADGYDTAIGEGGRALSGGQRQRIGLARALYGNPAFLVLDEPNANLDTLGEQALVRALEGLRARNATAVVITHRMNILGCVDKILVLREGVSEMFGGRDEIMARLSRPTIVASKSDASVTNDAKPAPAMRNQAAG